MPGLRQTSIDYMKSALVVGMILAHALQLLSKPTGIFWLFSEVINLLSFSGFLFCFGYVFYVSYFTKPFHQVSWRIAKTAWKTLLGYYIAGFASLILLNHALPAAEYPFSMATAGRLILLLTVPLYTEFLLAFFVITLLALLFFGLFVRLTNAPVAMALLSISAWLTAALLPVDFTVAMPAALLIGTRTYTLFPVFQYLPFFVAGLYMAKNNVGWHWVIACISLIGTGVFTAYFLLNQAMPQRFLPSVYWLVGPAGILYSYFLVAKWVERRAINIPVLLSIGQNTLVYLIVSNIILLAMSSRLTVSAGAAVAIGVSVVLVINFLIGMVRIPTPVAIAQSKSIKPAVPVAETL